MYASVESDREFACNVGAEFPERAWILAPSDCWYPNPYYSGPTQPHPEDGEEDPPSEGETFVRDMSDEEIPF